MLNYFLNLANTMERKMSLLKSLNIESTEAVPVFLLILQSVFLGVFYGAFDIGAHTLFLNTYPEDMIPKAYTISGVVGIVLTASFSKLQSKIPFSKLATYSLLFIALVTFLMRTSFFITEAPWTVMVIFILFGPLNIIGILAFWGTVGRIFNLRQGKRLYGIIDAGQIFGIILSSYIIPITLVYLKGTNNLLIISAFSALLAMLMEIIITRKFSIDKADEEEGVEKNEEDESIQLSFKEFIKDPYVLYMALFVAFSMFAAFFVQYSFLVVTKEKYPLEEEMAKFLGFFTGTMMVFILLIKTFVYSKLVKTYGLKISLILSSVLLALFTAIAIGSGYISGYEAHSAGFIYFFLFISLGKLFNKTLKDALELPSFKILYQALNKKIRYDVQAKIDGTVNEIAALISGILLSVLSLIAVVKLIHYSVVLFILLGLWTLITIRLYKEYRNSLEKALKAKDSFDDKKNVGLLKLLGLNISSSSKDFLIKIQNASSYLPYYYHNLINGVLDNYSKAMNIDDCIVFTDFYLENCKKNEQIKPQDKKIEIRDLTLKDLTLYLNSNKKESIVEAFEYVERLSSKNRYTIISALLRTPRIQVQQIAVKLCGYYNVVDACPTLIEFIDSEELRSNAIVAINSMSDTAYKQLIQVFFRTDISLNAQLVIINVLGEVNKPEVISFLLDNLSKHNTNLIYHSINSLIKLEYQADEKTLSRLFPPITLIAEYVAWDIAMLSSLNKNENTEVLVEAMENELEYHQNFLFDFLKICYNAKSVENVQDYIQGDSSEGVGYGLELFDMFLSEEIKPIILLLFDDMSLDEKSKQLENYFAIEVSTFDKAILNIINRDPNLISKRIKKIALTKYSEHFTEVFQDVVAHLFSSVEELQLLAAKSILQLEPVKFKQIVKRIEYKNKKALDRNLKENENIKLNYYMIDALKKQLINKLSKSNNCANYMFEWIEFDLLSTNKNISLIDQICNYFVFLIIDQDQQDMNIADNEPVFNLYDKFDFQTEQIESKKIIIGIKKKKMNEIAIIERDFVQNLLNIS